MFKYQAVNVNTSSFCQVKYVTAERGGNHRVEKRQREGKPSLWAKFLEPCGVRGGKEVHHISVKLKSAVLSCFEVTQLRRQPSPLCRVSTTCSRLFEPKLQT